MTRETIGEVTVSRAAVFLLVGYLECQTITRLRKEYESSFMDTMCEYCSLLGDRKFIRT